MSRIKIKLHKKTLDSEVIQSLFYKGGGNGLPRMFKVNKTLNKLFQEENDNICYSRRRIYDI